MINPEQTEFILGLINDPLKSLNVKHAFISGTLLGLARTGKLIENDVDIDVAIPYSSNSYVKEILAYLKKWDFVKRSEITRDFMFENIGLEREGTSYELCFMHENSKYAWFTWLEHGKSQWITLAYPFYMWETLDSINGFPVPSNYEEYLRMTYGDDWRTPNADYYKSEEGFYLTGKEARKYDFNPNQ